jgi:hypothetical protein
MSSFENLFPQGYSNMRFFTRRALINTFLCSAAQVVTPSLTFARGRRPILQRFCTPIAACEQMDGASGCFFGDLERRWSHSLGNSGFNKGNAVCLLSSGGILVAGIEDRTSPGGILWRLDRAGRPTIVYRGLQSIESVGVDWRGAYYVVGYSSEPEPIIQKLRNDGTMIWTTRFQQVGLGLALAISSNAQLFVTASKLTDPNHRRYSCMVYKMDLDGRRLWSAEMSGMPPSEAVRGRCLAPDLAGGVYVGGEISRAVGIETNDVYHVAPSKPTVMALDAEDSRREGIIARISPLGRILWTRRWAEGNRDRVVGVLISKRGEVFASGRSGSDGLIRRYDEHGNTLSDVRLTNSIVSAIVPDRACGFHSISISKLLNEMYIHRWDENLNARRIYREQLPPVSSLDFRAASGVYGDLCIVGTQRWSEGSGIQPGTKVLVVRYKYV